MNRYIVKRFENIMYSAVIEAHDEEEAEEISDSLDESDFRVEQFHDFTEVNEITKETDALEYRRLPVIEYETEEGEDDE